MIAIKVRDLRISYMTMKPKSIREIFKRDKRDKFEAVRGVSFDVEQGQIVGIIGKNGSGKSTLLRALAGVFSANSGTIDTGDMSISLLAIGVGFQKELTGRENIFLSGLLMGFSEEQIKAKLNEIIEFSEIEKFIDKPVKTYSSGMYSKLAFSITAVMDTDIILIDEVLSVGDARFKKKSYAKMESLIKDKEKTVMIVSHNLDTIKKLCKSVIWIHEGELKMQGETKNVLSAYSEFMNI